MDGWALSTIADAKDLRTIVEASMQASGFEKSKPATRSKMQVELYPHPAGTLILVQSEVPNPAIADDITQRLGTPTTYLELRLEDSAVSGIRRSLPGGTAEDIDTDAKKISSEWNEREGRKVLTESFPDLVQAMLAVADAKKPVVLSYAIKPLSRVASLVKTIQAGGKWERTSIGGQPAIKVVGPAGSQISVLTAAEEAELIRTIDAAPSPSTPAPAAPAPGGPGPRGKKPFTPPVKAVSEPPTRPVPATKSSPPDKPPAKAPPAAAAKAAPAKKPAAKAAPAKSKR